jgi:hypothetical protein
MKYLSTKMRYFSTWKKTPWKDTSFFVEEYPESEIERENRIPRKVNELDLLSFFTNFSLRDPDIRHIFNVEVDGKYIGGVQSGKVKEVTNISCTIL